MSSIVTSSERLRKAQPSNWHSQNKADLNGCDTSYNRLINAQQTISDSKSRQRQKVSNRVNQHQAHPRSNAESPVYDNGEIKLMR